MAAFDIELSKNLDMLEDSTQQIDLLLTEYKSTESIILIFFIKYY
jgi:hypothetical protein